MVQKLAQFTDVRAALVVGGLSLQVQAATLRSSPEIIVATPVRLLAPVSQRQAAAQGARAQRIPPGRRGAPPAPENRKAKRAVSLLPVAHCPLHPWHMRAGCCSSLQPAQCRQLWSVPHRLRSACRGG